MNRPLVTDRRDQVRANMVIRHLDRRRPTLPRIATPRMLVGRRAGLIAPGDLRILLGCPFFDGRVGLFQPLAHLLRILVLGMAARPLGCVIPPLEVLTDGPNRYEIGRASWRTAV